MDVISVPLNMDKGGDKVKYFSR